MSRDVSSIPRPLRKGDRVRADVAYRVVGTFESVNDSGRCWVREDNGDLHVVDLEHVTRIDDAESSASPLASTTREDGASGDAVLCDGGERQAAFLSEVRCLSHEIQKVSMTGMGGERLLQANRLWNELHELIKLGDPRP